MGNFPTTHPKDAAVYCDREIFDNTIEKVDFGYADSKDRQIGARISRFTVSYAPSGRNYGYLAIPGTYAGFQPHASRNGTPFGAIQSVRTFDTAEEREAAIRKYVAAATKRAAKNGTPVLDLPPMDAEDHLHAAIYGETEAAPEPAPEPATTPSIEADPLSVPCPFCGARRGNRCKSRNGKRRPSFHGKRLKRAIWLISLRLL